MPGVQRLQFFLSESSWEAERVSDRWLEPLREQPAPAPHDGGVIVIDDSGDREDGTATAHVGRPWLGRLGKTDNGIVTVTTVPDRWPRVVPDARTPLHPRSSLRPWPGRSGLPYGTAAGRRSRGAGAGRRASAAGRWSPAVPT
ncbi:transposase [Streptomyces sp. NPDC001868]|uniref:transposase n=1 Tax=Streptomyces sp. NPDC001868 TaxID=3154401 RepID=UPI00332C47FB